MAVCAAFKHQTTDARRPRPEPVDPEKERRRREEEEAYRKKRLVRPLSVAHGIAGEAMALLVRPLSIAHGIAGEAAVCSSWHCL